MGRVRWVLGVLLVAAGLASAVGIATADDIARAAPYALYAAMALVLGAAALAPVFVPVVAALLAGPFTAGPVGSLVRAEARTAARRTASVAAPVLLTFSFAVLVSGMVQTSTRAYGIGRAAAVDAGYVLAPDSAPGLSDAAVTAAPGAAVLPTTVYVTDSEPRDALGVDAAAFADVNNRLKVVSGSVADLQGPDTVVLTESAAARYGPLVRVTFADGESVPLRVVAVVSDGSAPVGLVLPRSTVRAHDPSALTSVVYLARPVPVPAGSGARLVDTVTHAREADAAEDRLVWVATLLLIGVSAGYGALAVANTLLLAARHRRANLRVLRLVGATDGQLLRLLAAEAVLVVTVGALLGGAVAGVALLGIRAGLAEQVGAPVALVVPWSVVAAVVGGCLLLAVLAGVTPVARRAASGD
jgi:putative ABC transport system permease protein